MALAGELAKYVGGELTKTAGKEVAKAGAKSALANLIADTGAKAVSKSAEKGMLNGLVPSTARKLASGVELGSEAIPLFRGQTNRLDKLDYNKGLSPNSNGFFMTPNKGATDSWAGKGVVSVDADPNDIMTLDELRSLKKDAEKYFRDPKYQMELYNTNPTQAEIYDALEAGDSYQELSRLTKKPFIERDGGQGTELGEIVFFPDTTPELTSRYNADLASGKNQWLAPTEDVVASETAVPAGTKIKFDKDLNISDIKKPSKGRGWFSDNEANPHISKAVKQKGLDKYLGEPKGLPADFNVEPLEYGQWGMTDDTYDHLVKAGQLRDSLYKEAGANQVDADKMLANWQNWNSGGRNKEFSDLDKQISKEIMKRRGETPVYRVETSKEFSKDVPSKSGKLSFTSDIRTLREYLKSFRGKDNTVNLYRTTATPENTIVTPEVFGTGNSQLEYVLDVGDNLQPIATRFTNMEGNFDEALSALEKDMLNDMKKLGAEKYLNSHAKTSKLSPLVADENGVAKTFYHGSPSMDITDFDMSMAGRNTRSGEKAIWFTDDYPTAEEFSYERIPGDTLFADKRGAKGKVYERTLGLENPLDLSNLSDKQIEELYKYADSRMAFDGKENFIRRMKEFRDAGNDQLIKSQLDMNKLSNSEYDGIVAKMYPGENEVREIGVFDTGKIKKYLDNKK